MNDYYNDPPECPDPPEWYCLLEIALEDAPESIATAIRSILDKWTDEYNAARDYEEYPSETVIDLPDDFTGPELCPHGEEWTNCDPCDHASDIAYDSAREQRSR
jgi:hypothetical protein